MDQIISEEDFELSLEDSNNKKIFGAIHKKYHGSIPADEIKSCNLIGLWKALKKYDVEKGRKFSNFLYVSVDWECKLYLRRNKRKYFSCDTFDSIDNSFNQVELLDIVESLKPKFKKVIKQRFFENLTIEEIGRANDYSRETARRHLNEAINQLKSCGNKINQI